MKINLPVKPNNKGFSLIELLVVIAIIAILSVIGISIYSNAQKTARDGVRRSEIDSISKSIESSRDPTTNTYSYTSTNFDADFTTAKPRDPAKVSTGPFYCVWQHATAALNGVPASWTTTCPTIGTVTGNTLVNETGTYQTAIANKYWKICASLEGTTGVVCKQSVLP